MLRVLRFFAVVIVAVVTAVVVSTQYSKVEAESGCSSPISSVRPISVNGSVVYKYKYVVSGPKRVNYAWRSEPAKGVSVVAKNLSSGEKWCAVTGNDGRYSIQVPNVNNRYGVSASDVLGTVFRPFEVKLTVKVDTDVNGVNFEGVRE